MGEIPHISIERIGFEELLRSLDLMPGSMMVIARSVMRVTMMHAEKIAHRRVNGEDIQSRTGDLDSAIGYKLENDRNTITGFLGLYGTRSPRIKLYGFAQEFGMSGIVPQTAELMTIPLPAALDSRGAPMFTPWGADKIFDRTFWKHSQAGNPILVGMSGDVMIPLFLGSEGPINIKGRHFLQNSVTEALPFFMQSIQDRFGVDIGRILAGGQVVDT